MRQGVEPNADREPVQDRLPRRPDHADRHEAIYQALLIHGRGGLSRELTACLRTGRALRVPRARRRRAGRHFITEEVKIGNRPVEVDDREQAGHWEGDLIIGLDKSAIGTLVERTTRYTMLLHLPRMEEFATAQRFKNGPPVAGHGAQAVRQAITTAMQRWPVHLRRTLTWDQGAEMAQHAELTLESGIKVFFCDPRSPWQRGTDENTNGVLRQYFPKGTDLCRHPNRRPRGCRRRLERPPPQDPGMAHSRRGHEHATFPAELKQCCDDP
ncbi:hypothetical protein GCM10023153_10370 [Ornithinibacter aureus]|uniref:Integrase catalytic domain-containing protein n=1 Tax=Ornithinibacter aureus TaxID=622664 RepID=A0ABP8JJM7_9MICO